LTILLPTVVFHYKIWRSWVNFTNIYFSQNFYVQRSQKCKKIVKLSVFFVLLGSANKKAAIKILGKIKPQIQWKPRTHSFCYQPLFVIIFQRPDFQFVKLVNIMTWLSGTHGRIVIRLSGLPIILTRCSKIVAIEAVFEVFHMIPYLNW